MRFEWRIYFWTGDEVIVGIFDRRAGMNHHRRDSG
jgi:hypothetical protein